MSQHYSEADLLETYYTQPGESMPVMMHLADCSECASRYENLERKLRALAACGREEKPDTFWARQRHGVMHTIESQNRRFSVSRLAAAAALTVIVGAGVFNWNKESEPPAPVSAPTEVTVAVPATEPADPWESEQLNDFQSIVAWESWEEPKGGKS